MPSLLGNAFRAMAFNEQAVRDIYSDNRIVRRELIGTAVATIIAALACGALLALCGAWFPNVFSAFSPTGWFWTGFGAGLILTLVLFAFTIGFTHLLARWLGGTATLGEYHAAFVWTSVPIQLLSILGFFALFMPGAQIIQLLITVYSISVQVFVVRVAYSLDWFKASVAVLVPLILLFILIVLLLLVLAVWGVVIGIGALQSALSGVF